VSAVRGRKIRLSRGVVGCKRGTPWSADEEAILASTLPSPEVARMIGRTTASVQQRRKKLSIKTPRRKAGACKHPAGCSKEIASHGWCRRHWYHVRNSPTGDPGPLEHSLRPWTPQEDALAMCNDVTRDEIAATLDRTVRSVRARQRRLREFEEARPVETDLASTIYPTPATAEA
jgi:hypothetical protein